MQTSISMLFVLLGIALVTSAGFCLVASKLSKKTVGRSLYPSTTAIWIIGSLLVQATIAAWAFHPLTYIIITGIVCIAEWIAIAVPEGRREEEIEPPSTRFLAWFIFALGPFASMIVASLQRADGWAFSGKAIPLYGLPLVAVLVVGLLRIALCGPVTSEDEEDDVEGAEELEEEFEDVDDIEEELDEQPEEELEELDEEGEEVEVIDGTELDEDELKELEELEIEDCDADEGAA